MRPLPPRRELERAFMTADARYDGLFVAGVRTTGIFCRPSCRARKPLAQHVEFFATGRAALEAGYRACRRCDPLLPDRTPSWVPHLLAALAEEPGDRPERRLLPGLGVDPARARRVFRRQFGMTMAAYARAHRLGRALDGLHRGGRLDEVVFDSGYASHSGFRDAFARLAGRPPGRAVAMARVVLAWFETPVGRVVAGATDEGACLLEFVDRPGLDGQLESVRRRLDGVLVPGVHPQLRRLERQLREYFAGARQAFDVPVVAPGSAFEMQVWEALQRIPYGRTQSYEHVARDLGRPGAARAVGRANGLNRVAILVPCHRVVGAGGTLVGYAGGVWRKRLLLHLERTRAPLDDDLARDDRATSGAPLVATV
jgi:AraC family transcriptional regulator, regulatory protein of adaptative response / methylated-DNA-[protein]-cysteine methyltransferase